MTPDEILKYVGLEEKESATYLALLEIGESTVISLSRKTGIKRPTTYFVLGSLEAKGLASRVIRKKQTLYIAQHPKKIITEEEIRLKKIKDAIPQLEAVMQSADNRPRIMTFEGKSALDRAYDESFVTKGEVLFMSNTALVQDVFARSLSKWDYATLSPTFSLREIIDDSELSHDYAKRVQGPFRQIRIMPRHFSPFETEVGVFGNNTLITSGTMEFFTVKIESEKIAHAFRALFEAMWQVSKPVEATTS